MKEIFTQNIYVSVAKVTRITGERGCVDAGISLLLHYNFGIVNQMKYSFDQIIDVTQSVPYVCSSSDIWGHCCSFFIIQNIGLSRHHLKNITLLA